MGVKPDITEFVGLAMARIFYFGVGFIKAVAAEYNQGGRISILGVSEFLG